MAYTHNFPRLVTLDRLATRARLAFMNADPRLGFRRHMTNTSAFFCQLRDKLGMRSSPPVCLGDLDTFANCVKKILNFLPPLIKADLYRTLLGECPYLIGT